MLRALALLAAFCAATVPASAAPRTYRVDAAKSVVQVHVGRAGVLSFAGHKHEVAAPRLTGTVEADLDALGSSSVSVTFEAAALRVTGRGEPAKDVPEVQAAMVGPEVLDAGRFPSIVFRSRRVAGRAAGPGAWELQVTGELSLHGVTRALTLPVRVSLAGDTLTATGRTVIRHRDFGMEPVSAAAGTVKVKNEIAIDFHIVARAAE